MHVTLEFPDSEDKSVEPLAVKVPSSETQSFCPITQLECDDLLIITCKSHDIVYFLSIIIKFFPRIFCNRSIFLIHKTTIAAFCNGSFSVNGTVLLYNFLVTYHCFNSRLLPHIYVVAGLSNRDFNRGSMLIRFLVRTMYRHACHKDMHEIFKIVSIGGSGLPRLKIIV